MARRVRQDAESALDRPRRTRAPALQLALAGFFATAVAFGPARMGFGLFVPAFRADLSLSTGLAGLIASGGFLAFLIALPLTAWLDARIGQRAPVVAGAMAAAAGFALIAAAPDAAVLAAGVALAGSSAGFCWTPFNDAAERVMPRRAAPAALSVVSSGATLGVAGAGGLAAGVMLQGLDWRAAWALFALAAALAALGAGAALPAGRRDRAGSSFALPLRRGTALFGMALAFGLTNAVYLTFAADRAVTAGGLSGLPDRAAAPVIFMSYGVVGLFGLAASSLRAWLGLNGLITAIFAAFTGSMILAALAPSTWPGLIAASGLHGAAVMTVSAVLSFWSLALWPGRGTLGFTAALTATAVGGLAGPAAGGALIHAIGGTRAFLIMAVPAAVTSLVFAWRSWRSHGDGAPERA